MRFRVVNHLGDAWTKSTSLLFSITREVVITRMSSGVMTRTPLISHWSFKQLQDYAPTGLFSRSITHDVRITAWLPAAKSRHMSLRHLCHFHHTGHSSLCLQASSWAVKSRQIELSPWAGRWRGGTNSKISKNVTNIVNRVNWSSLLLLWCRCTRGASTCSLI